MTSHTAAMKKYDLTVTRIINAPRALVFRAWTDPVHLAQWWGPNGFTNPVCKVDLRPGGAIHIDMRAPDGTVYPMGGTFHEILEPERLVFTSAALDSDGKPMFEVMNTIAFAVEGDKTKLTVHAEIASATANAEQYLQGMDAGWNQSLDRLTVQVEK